MEQLFATTIAGIGAAIIALTLLYLKRGERRKALYSALSLIGFFVVLALLIPVAEALA